MFKFESCSFCALATQAMSEPLRPGLSCEVVLYFEDGETVRITFSRDTGDEPDGNSTPRNQIPLLLTELGQKTITRGLRFPLTRTRSGQASALPSSGYGFASRQDHFVLTLHVEVVDQGRGVTVPIASL